MRVPRTMGRPDTLPGTCSISSHCVQSISEAVSVRAMIGAPSFRLSQTPQFYAASMPSFSAYGAAGNTGIDVNAPLELNLSASIENGLVVLVKSARPSWFEVDGTCMINWNGE